MRLVNSWNTEQPNFNPDILTHKIELQEAVPNDALCIVGSDKSRFIYFYHLNKKGWNFHNRIISTAELEDIIRQGGEYLYSDDRALDENEALQPYFEELILERGTVKVFKLKKTK